MASCMPCANVTGTTASLPLIASSIMSKKLAAGANGIVLDVKTGNGAFMPTVEETRALATIMVQIGVDARRDMVALIADMNQPLGVAVGNALEVAEAARTLQGEGPALFEAHCVEVAAQMLRLAGRGERWVDADETRAAVTGMLRSGKAKGRFRQMVADQGGDVGQIDDLSRLPRARIQHQVNAERGGHISQLNAGNCRLGDVSAGRGARNQGRPD